MKKFALTTEGFRKLVVARRLLSTLSELVKARPLTGNELARMRNYVATIRRLTGSHSTIR